MLRKVVKKILGNNLPFLTSVVEVRKYWEDHNVTQHKEFLTVAESLNYLDWRNDQYPGYIELMPHRNFDNLTILDYGCGPGHDLVGLGTFSKPKKLIGADVSRVSLEESKKRLNMHKIEADLIAIDPKKSQIEIPENSVDYINCSGVLHHIDDEKSVIKEFHRILKPGGTGRIMIYNYDSIWVHLYVAYTKKICDPSFKDLSLKQAFTKTTDGINCPIAKCYTPEEFIKILQESGFEAKFCGAAASLFELSLIKDIPVALMHQDLPAESRKFLLDLTYDSKLIPSWKNNVAGIDAVFEIRKL